MSLWVDKYRPKALDKLDYHTALSQQLKKLVRRLSPLQRTGERDRAGRRASDG